LTSDPPTIGSSFDPRRNSLNFLRLVLALTVVASHAIDLGGYGRDWIGNRSTIGQTAVYGFFGISGYLIASSAERNRTGRYLWQRFLRIFPAYWVCLFVTAFVLALVGWIHIVHLFHLHPGIGTYFNAKDSPVGYITSNWYLKLNQYSIAGIVWNGSLWTLFYEFLCYLVLAALAVTGLLKRRSLVLVITVALWLVDVASTFNPAWQSTRNPGGTIDFRIFLELAPVFLTGTLIYLYRDRVRDSGWLALGCTAGLVGSLWMPFGGTEPAFTLTSTEMLAPLIAYPMLWLGIHLPFHRVGVRNDYSYGVYIYAFPMQVLLSSFSFAHKGYVVFLFLSVAVTVPLAVASWWLVERPALRLKKWTPSWMGSPGPSVPQAAGDEIATTPAGESGPTPVAGGIRSSPPAPE
jgi:peptidoglycan/LPS O-acetylase OafA/YrhL